MKPFCILIFIILSQIVSYGQSGLVYDTIKLPDPDKNKGMSVMQALNARKTSRDFSDKKLTLVQLSEILWSANGINREEGKRTAPTAMNKQFVEIYLVLQEGVFLYDAIKNRIIPVKEGDFRKETGSQDFVSFAPVNLVYVADLEKLRNLPSRAGNLTNEDKLKWAYIGAGSQAENVHLYCASEGLGAVVRGSIDGQKFAELIKLRQDQFVLFAQTVGKIK